MDGLVSCPINDVVNVHVELQLSCVNLVWGGGGFSLLAGEEHLLVKKGNGAYDIWSTKYKMLANI